ncbi:MAG TPA: carbon starvation protein A [Spirochaeta sp.]|nr:carbon starvation protein A [Spirochaeta sp.]
MTTLIVVVGIVVYITLYLTYGKKLEKEFVKADDNIKTPAVRFDDGVDYIPSKAPVLFGHHFASIAGAAPIIGPVLAMAWGWVPALLWVWFGNIFIGAVHDYLSLMASVRYDGKSIQFVASDLITKRTGRLFYWLVFFLLILVIAAFGAVVNGMFVGTPEIPTAYIMKIAAALILGVLIYRVKMNFTLATIIGIILLGLSIWGGSMLPIVASKGTWYIIIFFYIIIASAIPVNVLLQPRDYLNSWLLYLGLIVGAIAAVFSFQGFTAPAFTSFAPIVSGGKATPFWPAIVLIIACGSLSGFHSLVASGTTSKQLEKESDGLKIGYGSMLTEGFLSTLVVVSVAGFGLELMVGKGMDITTSNWGTNYTSSMMGSYPKAAMFTGSYAAMVASTWLKFIPTKIVQIIAGMWVASFAMTTLDTTNRLGRYTFAEILSPLKDKNEGVYNFFTNRWIASLVPAVIGIYLAWSGNFTILWPSFGTANQLIASIALLTGVSWITKRQKTKGTFALIPAYLLWITVTAAIIWFSAVVLPGTIMSNPVTGITVLVIEVIMLIMNIIFIIDFLKHKDDPLDA